jgi:caffeoyl-CoA O-methyltransferase
LKKDGKLITIDNNEELEDRIRGYFNASTFHSQIELRIGNASEIIPALNERFDLVFIDADKVNYFKYYELVFPKVRAGGIILADNVLWSGKVVNETPDRDTQVILDFNRRIHEDHRVENVLLPIRDGIMMIRKLSL